jgi:hypothetical protein
MHYHRGRCIQKQVSGVQVGGGTVIGVGMVAGCPSSVKCSLVLLYYLWGQVAGDSF